MPGIAADQLIDFEMDKYSEYILRMSSNLSYEHSMYFVFSIHMITDSDSEQNRISQVSLIVI